MLNNFWVQAASILQKAGLLFTIMKIFKRVHWRLPSDSLGAPECIIADVDLDLPPEWIAYVGVGATVMRMLDPNTDTDHPVFAYMGEQQEKGEPARLSVTLSISRRESGGGGNKT